MNLHIETKVISKLRFIPKGTIKSTKDLFSTNFEFAKGCFSTLNRKAYVRNARHTFGKQDF